MQIAPAEFHTWAQQALNRVPGIQFKITGESHEEYTDYKDAVRAYQKDYVGKVTGVVDEKTYNSLIANNHIDPSYNRWIRESLAKAAGKPGLTAASGQTPDLIKAIRDYQGSKKGALNVDGWVGVKTELVLYMEASVKIPVPNPQGPIQVPIEARVTKWLEQLNDDLSSPLMKKDLWFLRSMHYDDLVSFKKFVDLLDRGTADFQYLDAQRVQDYLFNRTGEFVDDVQKANAMHYLRNLMRYYENVNNPKIYQRFAVRCQQVWKDVDQGLFQTIYQQKISSADGITKGRMKRLMDWTEGNKKDWQHILSAWPPWDSWSGKWN